ncbi:MAG: thiamine-phosphate kinase [Chloracidobacterium sp.]|nr:thiamine-phosphate kinase [Chloracidobacterium sp.]
MVSEFDFIKNIKAKYGLRGIGDDCAVLPKNADSDSVITADLLVEDVDFRLDWTSPELLGSRVLAVSLSDIAAMGAESIWAMLSLAVTDSVWNSDFLEKFYEGWFTLARRHNVELVGGDVSRTAGKIVFDSIVGGDVPRGKAVLRSGAQIGDSIFVTGPLGGAAGGLMMLESGIKYGTADPARQALITKQLRPVPRIEIGRQLREAGLANSMIDLSDGLSSDLRHICNASHVGARLYANDIPICPVLTKIGVANDQALSLALNGGEDFELLFTSKDAGISLPGQPDIYRIGEITANEGVIEVIGGEFEVLQPGGYRHF